ncbi:MAG: hypothetical protein WBD46_16520 [Acidobacteriaceae bacterium]
MTLQTARLIWAAFLCAACCIVFIARILTPPPHPTPAAALSWILAAVGAVDIVFIGALRSKILARSQEQSMRGEKAAAQAAWTVAQVLGFAAAMSIVLFGFVFRMLDARPPWFSAAFFVAGLLLLVGYYPRSPETR